jgi:DNA-binding CsgD family transcriptional regulator
VETTAAIGVARRRIIKRPRLTRMLDESRARIILLVAPAGYGKTTLAHEWLDERQAAWYRCGPASADVAALAVGLATATSEIVPGAGDRMRQRLRATDRPEEDADLLGEMLAEDLAEWPEDAWLVIDDYHFAMESAASEGFVQTLVELTPLNLVLASRRRPSWATARLRLYGHMLELDRTSLAMKGEEAFDLLSARKDASNLVDQAAGWPAVLGLAALTTALPARSEVPIDLYDYFAEELLNAVERDQRSAICQLAVIPSITRDSAIHVVGPDAQRALADGVATGILLPAGANEFELHPLLRTFLQERLQGLDPELFSSTVDQVGHHLLEHRLWDDALSLARGFGGAAFLEALIEVSWELLLDEGRLATLSSLIDLASELRIRSPLLDLVESELAFRQAAYRKAETLALEAGRGLEDQHLLVRAHVRAGQSAHLDGRDREAITYHRLALVAANTEADKREAMWGEFVCSMALETEDCSAILGRLEALGADDASDDIRVANGRMLLAMRTGSGFDPELLSAVYRLTRVDDPLIRSSFLQVWSYVLTYMGRYGEALDAADQQLREADQNRLAFVRPHGLVRRALALRGMKRHREALQCLTEAQRDRESQDDHFAVSADSARIGVLLALGDIPSAIAIPEPSLEGPVAANAVAELIAIRGLALACAERLEEAEDAASRSQALSDAAEPQNLARLARAVRAMVAKSPGTRNIVSEAFAAISRSQNIDALVTAYRGFPPLLKELATTDSTRAEIGSILTLAGDLNLGRGILPASRKRIPVAGVDPLSPREREVLSLVSQGLRNQDIAQRLFISEVTVKVHVRNIMRKLGARSRAHAVSLGAEID